MPLSELTTESYFKLATLVRDWRDYHYCGRMFHPPLLASNWFLFCLCLSRDIYSTCRYCNILLRYAKHFAWFQCKCTKRDWISYSCWQIRILSCPSHERSVQAFIHMIVQCALRCCATCIGTVLDKCWIEAIELLSFTIKWAKIVPTQTWCLFLCYNKTLHHPLHK